MADLLHCELLNVGGHVYRVYGSIDSAARGNPNSEHEEEEYGVSLRGAGAMNEEEDDMGEADATIMQEGGQFVCTLDVDVDVLPFIIGAKGKTKQRIEQDTGARLLIPRRDPFQVSGGSQVVIRGDSRGSVARAKTQLELVISSALSGSRLDYNYFISLPLASAAVQSAMDAFKQWVLSEPGAATSGIEDSIFMKSAHLHLTLAMLKLYSEERRERARQVLHSLAPAVQQLLQGAPLRVQLKGLEYMNDDPSQMHVMFLGVRDPLQNAGALHQLQQLCAAVVGAFSEAGLLLPQDERAVKLHATVINSRYRRHSTPPGVSQQQQQQQGSAQQGQGRPRSERQPFDGRVLLNKYADVDFGVVELPAVHLSQRGKYGPDGFYFCADSLPLVPQ